MKKIIKAIVRLLVWLWSYIYSPAIASNLMLCGNQLYTMWLEKEFSEFGPGGFVARPMSLRGGQYIKIGKCFNCDQRLRLDAIDVFLGQKFSPEIIIGNNVSIQKDCHIGAIGRIVIGDGVLFASKVYVSDHSHGEINAHSLKTSPALRYLYSKGDVIIGSNVWIGESACILPGVTIGHNSIIGAGAIVTKSIPPNSVAVGNPARVIRRL